MELIEGLYSIVRPWFVSRVDLNPEIRRLDAYPDHEDNCTWKCLECGTELNTETVQIVGTAVSHGRPHMFKGKLNIDWPDKPYERFSIECGNVLKEVHELGFMQELRALLGTEYFLSCLPRDREARI